MIVRKSKSISPASSSKTGDVGFTDTTADNKARNFKGDANVLREFFAQVGTASDARSGL